MKITFDGEKWADMLSDLILLLKTLDPLKKYELIIKEHKERRSLQANAYSYVLTDKLAKKMLIAVDGQLQTRQYQTKDGSNRSAVEVVAENVSFTGERRDATNNQPFNTAPGRQQYMTETNPWDGDLFD